MQTQSDAILHLAIDFALTGARQAKFEQFGNRGVTKCATHATHSMFALGDNLKVKKENVRRKSQTSRKNKAPLPTHRELFNRPHCGKQQTKNRVLHATCNDDPVTVHVWNLPSVLCKEA